MSTNRTELSLDRFLFRERTSEYSSLKIENSRKLYGRSTDHLYFYQGRWSFTRQFDKWRKSSKLVILIIMSRLFKRNYVASLTRSKWEKSDKLLIRFSSSGKRKSDVGIERRSIRANRRGKVVSSGLVATECKLQLLDTEQASNNQ